MLKGIIAAAALCGILCAQPNYSTAAADVRNGHSEQAIPVLQQLVTQSPSDLKARNLLGIALMNAGRKEEARVQFEKALTMDPNFRPALKNLAVDEMALGRRAEAKRHFEKLLKDVPNDPVAHLYLGEIAFADRRYLLAVNHYEQSGGLHLKDPPVTLHFASSALESKQAAVAEGALQSLPASDAESQFKAGVLLSQANRFPAAARHFELARKGYADPYEAGFNLTLVYLNAGNYSAAIATGNELAREHPKAELYNLLARAYEASGQTQQAYDALRAATGLDPLDERNYVDLMSLCLAHENWDLSLEISTIALSHIPAAYRVRLQRGAVFAMMGRLDDAETEFFEAVRIAPQSAVSSVALALVEMQLKRPEKAVEMLRARRAKDRKDYLVNWFLAEALTQEESSTDEAIAALEDAVKLNPSVAGPRVLLGKLLVKRGEPDRAARQFEEALRLKPDDHTAAYPLAMIYRRAGNLKRAEELMAIAAKATSAADPSTPGAGSAAREDLVRIIREASK